MKANSTADGARSFFKASLQQRFGGRFETTARFRGVSERKVGRWAKRVPGGRAWSAVKREGRRLPFLISRQLLGPCPVKKIVSKVPRTPRMRLWESHQGGGDFAKVAESLVHKRPPSRAQESLGPSRLLPGRMSRPGESPARRFPLTSKPHVNNLPLPALQTSPRAAAVGGRGPDAEPARKAARLPAHPSLEIGLRGDERMSVVLSPTGLPTWLPRPSPWTSQSSASPGERWSWGADEGANWARGGRGGRRSLRRACRPAGRGG